MSAVVNDVAQLKAAVRAARAHGLTIGLVPTMGALHAGHASLLRSARVEAGYVVASIFVNPMQFGPHEDLAHYPRTWEADVARCQAENVDLVFAPPPEVVYPQGFQTFVEVVGLQDVLERKSRPGHFRGVATVVLKLLNMVQPDVAYFGQKDAQQACVIRRMMRDLDVPVTLRVCPTVREPDGLALSSRNRYLTPAQREQASCLFRALQKAEALFESGERRSEVLQAAIMAVLQAAPEAQVDYVALVDHQTLAPVARLEGEVLVALAVRFGETRLIDNLVLNE